MISVRTQAEKNYMNTNKYHCFQNKLYLYKINI